MGKLYTYCFKCCVPSFFKQVPINTDNDLPLDVRVNFLLLIKLQSTAIS